MSFIETLAISMGASWVSGINLYAAVATLGLLGRFADLKLPGDLDVVTNWWVIGVALVLFVIEFVADKIQLVDSPSTSSRHHSHPSYAFPRARSSPRLRSAISTEACR
jgi:hypothetical protein